jgi:hypothetical protein
MVKKYLSIWYVSNKKSQHLTFLNLTPSGSLPVQIFPTTKLVTECQGEIEGDWSKENFEKLLEVNDKIECRVWEDWEMKFNGKGWKVYMSKEFCHKREGGLCILERKDQYSLGFCKDEFDKIWVTVK